MTKAERRVFASAMKWCAARARLTFGNIPRFNAAINALARACAAAERERKLPRKLPRGKR